jgi:hypothetical protein
VKRNLAGIPPTIVVGFTLRLPDGDPLPRLVSAAAQLLSEHRLLSCCVLDYDTLDPCFGAIAEVDPASVVDVEVSSDTKRSLRERINSLLHREIRRPFDIRDKSTLLWRISASVSSDPEEAPSLLALTISHAISDGVGARLLAGRLLDILKTSSSSPPEPVSKVTIPSGDDNLKVPPALEEAYDTRPSVMHLLKVFWRIIIRPKLSLIPRDWLWPSPSFWTGEPVPVSKIVERKSHSRVVLLPSLVEVARSRGLTV